MDYNESNYFKDFEEFRQRVKELRASQKLHPLAEARIAHVLRELYPSAFALEESTLVFKGRADLMAFLPEGLKVHIEVIASKKRIRDNIRLLSKPFSMSNLQIVVIMDEAIDKAVFQEYVAELKRLNIPFEKYPWLKTGDVLCLDKDDYLKKTLEKIIDKEIQFIEIDEGRPRGAARHNVEGFHVLIGQIESDIEKLQGLLREQLARVNIIKSKPKLDKGDTAFLKRLRRDIRMMLVLMEEDYEKGS